MFWYTKVLDPHKRTYCWNIDGAVEFPHVIYTNKTEKSLIVFSDTGKKNPILLVTHFILQDPPPFEHPSFGVELKQFQSVLEIRVCEMYSFQIKENVIVSFLKIVFQKRIS